VTETVTDAKGRRIELRPLVGSKLSRFIMACGSAYGENLWTGATTARANVAAIDDKPTPPTPTTLDQVHQLWDAVDDDATAAAYRWMVEQQAATLADAKNSLAPPDSDPAPGS
jgi:hypothetical protein